MAHKNDPAALRTLDGYEFIPLHSATALDKKGRKIGKAPKFRNWRSTPAFSLEEAEVHMENGGNIGVRMRADDLVLDVDPRHIPAGDDPLRRLSEDTGFDFAMNCPQVITGSKGFHFYMKVKPGQSFINSLEAYPGLEFKSFGRQLVAPGSIHPDTGRLYVVDPLSVGFEHTPQAPDKLIDLIRRPPVENQVEAGEVSPEELEGMLDALDVLKFRDHDKWLNLMMACHHATNGEGRDEFIAWSTSDPEYGTQEWAIGLRWDSLHTDGTARITKKTLFKELKLANRLDLLPGSIRATPQDDFKDFIRAADGTTSVSVNRVPESLSDTEIDLDGITPGDPAYGPLERLNEKWCLVDDDGKVRFYKLNTDYEFGEARKCWIGYAEPEFHRLLANQRIFVTSPDGTQKLKPVSEEWVTWGMRREYTGIVFDPGQDIDPAMGTLNLWTGWGIDVNGEIGSWYHFDRLIFEGLAAGHRGMYEYILNWVAMMIQKPNVIPEVALVFRGEKGIGKSTLGVALATLAGNHGLHISNTMHLTNHFNAHLRNCLFLFSDEAMWGGNKEAEGTLKQLITEHMITYEAKGRDPVKGRNRLHVLMASNADWVVPASGDERRFAVSDVSSRFMGDTKFWDALNEELYGPEGRDYGHNPGLLAFYYDMLNRDISKFNPRSIPVTSGLAHQKLKSLDGVGLWWMESLLTGDMGNAISPAKEQQEWDNDVHNEKVWFFCTDLQEAVFQHLKRQGDRYAGKHMDVRSIGRELVKWLARDDMAPDGDSSVRSMDGAKGIERKLVKIPDDRPDLMRGNAQRTYAYGLPNLHESRMQFQRRIGVTLDWESGNVALDPE